MSKPANKKIVAVAVKAVTALLVGPIVLYMVLFGAALAWIAYRPVPPAPRFTPEYVVAEAGAVSTDCVDAFDNPLDEYGARLTDTGKITHFDELAWTKDKTARKDVFLQRQQQIAPGNRYPPTIMAVYGRHTLLRDFGTQLWRDGKNVVAVPHKVQGYSWDVETYGFYGLNTHDDAIGNARIATGYATSGGTSSPHGRDFPLLWHGDSRPPEDLNSRIARATGWHLDRAVDINNRGQILCVGRKADDREAEQYSPDDERYVVLTPLAH